jgi:hypothetical protein
MLVRDLLRNGQRWFGVGIIETEPALLFALLLGACSAESSCS